MADDVDISLKLGTEADLSSAINAGARAGAAFAAAAQAAVSGISLSASSTMRAFQTSTRQIATSADIRALATNGFATRAATGGFGGGNGGWGSKPFAPLFPDPNKGKGTGVAPYGMTGPRGAFTISNGKAYAWDSEDKIYKELHSFTSMYKRAYDEARRGGGGGSGGGGDLLQIEGSQGGRRRRLNKAAMYGALGWAKQIQTYLRPAAEYIGEAGTGFLGDWDIFGFEGRAGYRAHTARSTQGFRQEKLERDTALWNMIGEYGSKGGMLAGAGVGAAWGSIVPGLGTVTGAVVGGIVGGIGGLIVEQLGKTEVEKKKQELAQQYKSLQDSQQRYYNNALFGGNYNTSFIRAAADLGIGLTEESQIANSSTALTFRGDLMRGRVSAAQMQNLAFMPNTLANYINMETDPAKLQAGYAADFGGLGDESLAASVAKEAVGLDTYAALKTPAYARFRDRFNQDTIATQNARANSVIGGYMNRQAQNVVNTQVAAAAELIDDARTAPDSFWGGQAKPTERETEFQRSLFNYMREAAMKGPLDNATPVTINVFIDGEATQVGRAEIIQERESYLTNGQSFITGGY